MKPIQSVLMASVVCTALSIVFVVTTSGGIKDGSVSASGCVYLDDSPVAEADIFLTPTNPTASIQAYHSRTDSYGQYKVDGGVLPGEYRVVIRRPVAPQQASKTMMYQPGEIDEGQMAAMMSAAVTRSRKSNSGMKQASVSSDIPAAYGSAVLTTLRVSIPNSGCSNADVRLTRADSSRLASGKSGGHILR